MDDGYELEEVVDEDAESALYRARDESFERVLVKALKAAHPSPATQAALERDVEASRLAGPDVALEIRQLANIDAHPAVVLQDPGAIPLARLIGAPMELDRFLPLAIRLADLTGALHNRQIVHRSLNPHHVMVLLGDELRLTDLGRAAYGHERRALPAPPWPRTMWPYLSPEQGGRLSAAVDHRSDLYALGVIYFQLLTGKLPLSANDLPGWIHSHAAIAPASPLAFVPSLPPPLAQIVLRLLAKLPEDRYQSDIGLSRDLARCEAAWRTGRHIAPFRLGEHDVVPLIQRPLSLYGREDELERLTNAIHQARGGGPTKLYLLSGPAGVGKTELMRHLRGSIRGALFAQAKSEAATSEVPYAALRRLLEQLVEEVVEHAGEAPSQLRERLTTALGLNAALAVELVPGLAQILGPVEPLAGVLPEDAERRLLVALTQLIRALVRPDTALVLFLDDLQWIDLGSARVIEHWISEPLVHHTLVIAATRGGPPRLVAPATAQVELKIAPLSLDAVTRWIGDVVRWREGAAELAAVLRQKTGGNPLFIEQLLRSLDREGLIYFSTTAHAWQWNLAKIQAREYSDNVADLIAADIRTLPPGTRDALRRFASQGTAQDFETLALLFACTEPDAVGCLGPAFDAKLLARVDHEARFLHDKIHQAALELTPPEEGPALHLDIARALLAGTKPERLQERVFDIARHFNAAERVVTDERERAKAAELDLLAGQSAQQMAAHTLAADYFESGLRFAQGGDVRIALTVGLAQAKLLTSDLDEAKRLCLELLPQIGDRIEGTEVYVLLNEIHLRQGDVVTAVETTLKGLAVLFDVHLSLHPTAAEVDEAYRRVLARIGDRPIEQLTDLPALTDPVALAANNLLATLHTAVYVDWNLVWLAANMGVEWSLDRGNTGSSSAAYSAFGLGLANRYGRDAEGVRFGEVGYRLGLKPQNVAFRARNSFTFAAFLAYRAWPIRRCLDLMERESQVAASIGDQTFASYLDSSVVTFRLFAGDHLDDLAEDTARRTAAARSAAFPLVQDLLSSQEWLVAQLRGAPHEGLTEEELQQHFAHPLMTVGRAYFWVSQLQARYLLGDHDGALQAADTVRPLLASIEGFLQVPEYLFFSALAMAEAPARLDAVRSHRDQLRFIARGHPANFEHREALLSAEIARLEGDELAAERAYETAIRLSRAQGALHVEALSAERAARFYQKRGFDLIAQAYLASARECYELWGAQAKVRLLDEQHPELATIAPAPSATADVQGILKAAQAISRSLEVHDLHQRLLRVAVENARAQRGCLLLASPQGFVMAAASGSDVESFGAMDQPADPARIPLLLCDAVRRTRRPVAIADARDEHRYRQDPYFVRSTARSVLCAPIVQYGDVMGLLYLENNLMPGAFSQTELGVLDVVATQAAISLENARLYSKLRRENTERKRAEATLSQNRQQLQDIIDNSTAVIFAKSRDGHYLLVNRRFEELFHVNRAEVLDKNDFDLFTKEKAEELRANDLRVLEGDGPQEIDESIPQDDGLHEYISLKFPLRDADGKAYAVCGVATDVTGRKRHEESLRHSLSLLNSSLESTADGILVVDREGRVVQFNQRFVDMWRIPAEVLASHDDSRLLSFVIDQLIDPGAFLARVTELYSQPDASSYDTLRFRDGRVYERYSQAQRLSGEVIGRVWSFRDITSRVRAEQQRDQLLAHEVHERSAAEQAVRLRDEFLSIASHELRTPLTSLQLAVQRLEQRWGQAPGMESSKPAIDLAVRQCKRLATLIGMLLDVSRIQAGKLEPSRANTDLRAVVDSVASQLQDQLLKAGSTLIVRSPRRVIGRWDASQLDQLVTNLLSNALKFGEGKPIEVDISSDGHNAQLSVKDHGIGISDEVQARLFERFGRGVSAKHYGGLGLGLFIARSIAEAHGGSIGVRSAPKQGSTFTTVLPLSGTKA